MTDHTCTGMQRDLQGMQRDLQKFALHQTKKSNPTMATTMAMTTIVLLFCKVKNWILKVKNIEFIELFGEWRMGNNEYRIEFLYYSMIVHYKYNNKRY